MPDSLYPVPEDRGAWVRLRTLVLLRWLAATGQAVAVLFTALVLKVELPLAACLAVIGALVVCNLALIATAPRARRMTGHETLLLLLLDLCQLGALLWLTGGLGNPFALLMIAPVTISASVLSRRATLLLVTVAIAIITLLALGAPPLHTPSEINIAPPPLVLTGIWCALVVGTVFLAVYARRVAQETLSMSQALAATQMALAREQQLAALGGVVAATAHELGTPLATIKLAATELVEALAEDPDMQADALLVRNQANRCSEILRSMGRESKQDSMVRFAPFSSIIEEAAEPHTDRGIRILTRIADGMAGAGPEDQPMIERRPEIIQGLRNLVQNAVDFAATTVWIDMEWSDTRLRLRIGDDGPGYSADLLGRIGDPFLRVRTPAPAERPGYSGMGLGLFIAETLLERTGARVTFGNAPEASAKTSTNTPAELASPTGAIVSVTWPRNRLAPLRPKARGTEGNLPAVDRQG